MPLDPAVLSVLKARTLAARQDADLKKKEPQSLTASLKRKQSNTTILNHSGGLVTNGFVSNKKTKEVANSFSTNSLGIHGNALSSQPSSASAHVGKSKSSLLLPNAPVTTYAKPSHIGVQSTNAEKVNNSDNSQIRQTNSQEVSSAAKNPNQEPSTTLAELTALRPDGICYRPTVVFLGHATNQHDCSGGVRPVPHSLSSNMNAKSITSANGKRIDSSVSTNFVRMNMKNRLGSCKSTQASSKSKRKALFEHRRSGSDESVKPASIVDARERRMQATPYFDYVNEISNTAGDDVTSSGARVYADTSTGFHSSGTAARKRDMFREKFKTNYKAKYTGQPDNELNTVGRSYFGIDALNFTLDSHEQKERGMKGKSSKAATAVSGLYNGGTSYFGDSSKNKGNKNTVINDPDILFSCAPMCSPTSNAMDITHPPGVRSKLLQVKKSGPNKGRWFYKCGAYPVENCCNFFMWCDVSCCWCID